MAGKWICFIRVSLPCNRHVFLFQSPKNIMIVTPQCLLIPQAYPPPKSNMSLIHLLLYRYRFCKGTRGCLMSIFKIHNETMNIWSHLLGFVFFAILTCLTFVSFNVSIYSGTCYSIDMPCLVHSAIFLKPRSMIVLYSWHSAWQLLNAFFVHLFIILSSVIRVIQSSLSPPLW